MLICCMHVTWPRVAVDLTCGLGLSHAQRWSQPPTMSSGTKSLAKLTSLSTQTLSLLLERQRLQSFPSASLNPNSQPKNAHTAQITKNLQQLRVGILEMEERDGRTEAVSLLRGQYERMRSMLGNDSSEIDVGRYGAC